MGFAYVAYQECCLSKLLWSFGLLFDCSQLLNLVLPFHFHFKLISTVNVTIYPFLSSFSLLEYSLIL